ncbi:hypothetical protein LSUB1_G003110 [Lachnellula subtilissima]|uniref:NAD(P)-binding domain-containing protein n=1 Tax=Lachnellula subtilissima TaxID=602034 RepID=A0A8H8RUQ0_9HELO|nr:hypothetical protein LSUB1_G003110 [Lachnellula subtilissima]
MRVLLLGGTGNLGKRCVPALLAHEHVLTIYVRNPSKFKHLECSRQSFLLPKIAKAVADAAIAVGNERGVPLRVWITAGLGLLKTPGRPYLIQEFAPYVAMAQHDATRKAIEPIPLTDLRWSLFCVGNMQPLDRQQTVFEPLNAPTPHNLLLGVMTMPAWVDSWWIHVPFVGDFVNIWMVLFFQYGTKYEAAADFLAEDLEKESQDFVGVRVGMKKESKSKDD